MYPRTNYEMTEADLGRILQACKPVPLLFLSGGIPMGKSQQQNANDAWAELGSRMGFDSMTVQPDGKGDRFFSAIPSETDDQRAERLKRETAEAAQKELATIEADILTLQQRRSLLMLNLRTPQREDLAPLA